MLKVEGVSKAFKNMQVLNQVSLEVSAGELVHITGANGSGKSTLFKLITGLIKPDSGTIELTNEEVIGALIENPGFLEAETAMTNLRFLANLNNRFDKTHIVELMTQFGLDYHNRQSVAKYSVGMRQKLGIIQAVMENQNVILLDEPTRGLDAESVRQFVALLAQLIQENKMVVVASHDTVPGLNYSRSLVLKDGCLQDA